MDIPMGESECPDGWVAAHYGPPLPPDEREGDRSPGESRSEGDDEISPRAEEEEEVPERQEEEIEEPEPEN